MLNWNNVRRRWEICTMDTFFKTNDSKADNLGKLRLFLHKLKSIRLFERGWFLFNDEQEISKSLVSFLKFVSSIYFQKNDQVPLCNSYNKTCQPREWVGWECWKHSAKYNIRFLSILYNCGYYSHSAIFSVA